MRRASPKVSESPVRLEDRDSWPLPDSRDHGAGHVPILKRYRLVDVVERLAAIATVVALLFAFQAIREAAHQSKLTRNQLELARQQAQPTFRLVPNTVTLKLDNSRADTIVGYSSLSVIMVGSAQNVGVYIDSALVFSAKGEKEDHVASFVSWWQETKPARDEVAHFRANPRLLALVAEDPAPTFWYLELTNIVSIYYTDVFGVDHISYHGFTGEPYDPSGIWSLNDEAAQMCREMLSANFPIDRKHSLSPQSKPYSAKQLTRAARRLDGQKLSDTCPTGVY